VSENMNCSCGGPGQPGVHSGGYCVRTVEGPIGWPARFDRAAEVAESRGCAPSEALRYVADWFANTPADNAEAVGRALLGEES
jgi:hypothetical protein